MEPLAAPQQQHRKSCRIVTQYGDMTVMWESEQPAAHLSPASSSSSHSNSHSSNQEKHQHQQKTQTARPIIMTFHDLGLNSELQFAGFCGHKEVRLMLQTFTMVHVNFVGQEPEAGSLEPGFKYPSCEQLAECIVDVCAHLRIRSFIALAVGAGAHIVSLLALMRPDLVDGLFLINPVMNSCSITEWLYFKMSAISAASHTPPHSNTGSPKSQAGLRARLLNHKHPPAAPQQQQQHQQQPVVGSPEVASGGGGGGGSRLRRLILSRNFVSANQAPVSRGKPEAEPGPPGCGKLEACTSATQQQSAAGSRRPPYEYLMYHHFGPGKFQRYRRSDDCCSDHSSPTAHNNNNHDNPQDSSHSSPVSSAGSAAASERGGPRLARAHSRAGSGSRCSSRSLSQQSLWQLNWSYLAGLGNPGLRQWHIQAAYRHHFGQLNAHNLWLFAESFAGRHSLNLRKDCGAAAHAAAAAATLGTSICSVFVGGAPPAAAAHYQQQQQQQQSLSHRQPAAASNSTGTGSSNYSPTGNHRAPALAEQVAGTKVKRTFTCQTLVMCSCVALHRERSFKLMSLLNPIQATCIQTDQLLVLEEKPEKVCQALRLFLQGIGYSMSTYERRLRLGSAPAGSSADSDSSTGSSSLMSQLAAGAHL